MPKVIKRLIPKRLRSAIRGGFIEFSKHPAVSRWFYWSLADRGYALFSDFGDHVLVFNPFETIGDRILRTGSFGRQGTEAVLRRVKEIKGRGEGGVFVEIGANIGTQTVYASLAHKFDRMVAFEPDPANLVLLRANVRLNALQDLVSIQPVALSDKQAKLCLMTNFFNSGASTVEPGFHDAVPKEFTSSIDVEAKSGDDALAELGIDVNDIALIWMDVERHEGAVIRGLQKTLESGPPLYFEYFPRQLSQADNDIIQAAVFDRYSTVFLDRNGFVPLDADGFKEIKSQDGFVNLLAL